MLAKVTLRGGPTFFWRTPIQDSIVHTRNDKDEWPIIGNTGTPEVLFPVDFECLGMPTEVNATTDTTDLSTNGAKAEL